VVETSTIEISIEYIDRLHRIAEQLEAILHKNKVSMNEVVGVLLAIKPLDVVLQDMMLEDMPEWKPQSKKPKK